ncbi:hypothetical protein ENBRE01_2188 [Enteropsectra breve]|nr:hypothetical protein ENBRE01_2188 [Enteropsectra breve]
MTRRCLNNEERRQIINLYLNGQDAPQIAQIMSLKRTTVISVIKVFNSDGRITAKARGGPRGHKITDEARDAIRGWIDEDCGLTLKALTRKLLEEFNIDASSSTNDRCIDTFNYSFKLTSLIPERRNSADVIATRKNYAIHFNSLLTCPEIEYNYYFIDEVGFNITMRTRGGRALRGRRANHTVSALRTRNISVCCAMSKHGITKYTSRVTAYNTTAFLEFVQELTLQLNNDGISNAIIIMDNVPFHRSTVISTAIEAAGYRALYLPPYSPFLNPIENMFSK